MWRKHWTAQYVGLDIPQIDEPNWINIIDYSIVYLEVPSSATNPTDLQLMFNFGTTSVTRSWNIKIAMLPCGASYLGTHLFLNDHLIDERHLIPFFLN